EIKSSRSNESCSDDTILEGKGREADGVILEIEISQTPLRCEFVRCNERRATDSILRGEIFGQRKKLGIAPHVEVASGEIFAPGSFLERVVVVSDFEGREAVFAKRARSVAPGFAAFPTSEFINDRHFHSPSMT